MGLTLRLSRGTPRVKDMAAVGSKRLLGLLIECPLVWTGLPDTLMLFG